MPSAELRHGAVFVKTLAEHLLEQGYSQEQVFGGTAFGPGLLKESKPVANYADIAAYFEKMADLTGNDVLGFQRGIVRDHRRIGLLCYVGLSSPTVADHFRNVARYRRVFSDAVEFDLSRLESDGIVAWHFRVPSRVIRRQQVEFGAAGLVSALRQACQRDIKPVRVTFRHMRNTNLDVFRDFLGCPVEFGASINSVTFTHSDLERPLVTEDNELYEVLKQYAEEVLQRKKTTASDLTFEVERAIANRLTSGEANQDRVSRDLGMSPRTLARRLARERTTFFKTLDDLRKSLAINYLKDSDLTLGEIAFLLGYSSLSSFSDAFRRWVGTSPRQYRAG